jgi:hypothetical protein
MPRFQSILYNQIGTGSKDFVLFFCPLIKIQVAGTPPLGGIAGPSGRHCRNPRTGLVEFHESPWDYPTLRA